MGFRLRAALSSGIDIGAAQGIMLRTGTGPDRRREKMARWATVATIRWHNTVNDLRKGAERVREIWDLLIDRAAMDRPDLLLLAEHFMTSGMMDASGKALPAAAQAEPVPGDGPVLDFIARKARQHGMYIMAGMFRRDAAGSLYNSAVLVDRRGAVAGVYDKLFPTPSEMEQTGITPGTAPGVFEADFGRLGAAVCFDLNFPEVFAALRARQVELCCFLSAMPGGPRLPALARDFRFYIASAALEGRNYIVNPLGAVLAQTGTHQNCVAARVNLDARLFHLKTGCQTQFDAIKRKYGGSVIVEFGIGEPWEPWYLLRCERDDMTADDVAREFDLEPLDNYLDRTRSLRRERVHGQDMLGR
jgi:predicted amidohydrolase